MPLTRKQVLAPNTPDNPAYFAGGVPYTFSVEDVRHLYHEGQRMLAAGLEIPVPLEHQKDAEPVDRADAAADRLRNNAGWVKKFILVDGQLYADLEIPDEELFAKLPRTVKFCSPKIDPAFTDGMGRQWGGGRGVITHVALTTRPVWAGQEQFSGQTLSLSIDGIGQAVRWVDAPAAIAFSIAAAIKPNGHAGSWLPVDGLAFAKWTAYQNPKTKKAGWKSEGGRVLYREKSPEAAAKKPAAPRAAKTSPAKPAAKIGKASERSKEILPLTEPETRAVAKWLKFEGPPKKPGQKVPPKFDISDIKISDKAITDAKTNYTKWANKHGAGFLDQLKNLIKADRLKIKSGQTHDEKGRSLAARMVAYRHMLTWANQDAIAATPQTIKDLKSSGWKKLPNGKWESPVPVMIKIIATGKKVPKEIFTEKEALTRIAEVERTKSKEKITPQKNVDLEKRIKMISMHDFGKTDSAKFETKVLDKVFESPSLTKPDNYEKMTPSGKDTVRRNLIGEIKSGYHKTLVTDALDVAKKADVRLDLDYDEFVDLLIAKSNAKHKEEKAAANKERLAKMSLNSRRPVRLSQTGETVMPTARTPARVAPKKPPIQLADEVLDEDALFDDDDAGTDEVPIDETDLEGGDEEDTSEEEKFEDVKTKLREVKKINLPDDTDEANFIDHLWVALHAIDGADEEGADEETGDEVPEEETELADFEVEKPTEEPRPGYMMSLAGHKDPAVARLALCMENTTRRERLARIKALGRRGLAVDDQKMLAKELMTCEMSISSSGRASLGIDRTLAILERTLPIYPLTQMSLDAFEVAQPGEANEKEQQAIIDRMSGKSRR